MTSFMMNFSGTRAPSNSYSGSSLRCLRASGDGRWSSSGGDDERFSDTEFAEHLVDCCTDRIFDLLPPNAEGLTGEQKWLISGVLGRYFHKAPTAEGGRGGLLLLRNVW